MCVRPLWQVSARRPPNIPQTAASVNRLTSASAPIMLLCSPTAGVGHPPGWRFPRTLFPLLSLLKRQNLANPNPSLILLAVSTYVCSRGYQEEMSGKRSEEKIRIPIRYPLFVFCDWLAEWRRDREPFAIGAFIGTHNVRRRGVRRRWRTDLVVSMQQTKTMQPGKGARKRWMVVERRVWTLPIIANEEVVFLSQFVFSLVLQLIRPTQKVIGEFQ